MPESADFLKEFGIIKGNEYYNYKLVSIDINHEEIEKYKEYYYKITLIFEFKVDEQRKNDVIQLVKSLKKDLKDSKVINSKYGNPYESKIHDITFEIKQPNHVKLNANGYAMRIKK